VLYDECNAGGSNPQLTCSRLKALLLLKRLKGVVNERYFAAIVVRIQHSVQRKVFMRDEKLLLIHNLFGIGP